MPLIPPESAEVAAWKAEQAQQVESKVREMEHWDRELKRIDPSLSLIVAKPGSEDVGLLPGRWHVQKEIPGAPDEFWPLVGPDDEYREPGAWVLDEFNANDLWDPRVHRTKKEAKQKLSDARARAKRLLAEQRAEEIDFQARAARRVRGESGLVKRTDLKASRKTLEARAKATEGTTNAGKEP
jgi:hypothetical protein